MTTKGLYFVISDGTAGGTITLADGGGTRGKYWLERGGWAPVITALRDDEQGEVESYIEVVEEPEINISGDTASEAYANLDKLARLLDQAERWSNNQNVAPVLAKFSPKGASVSSIANPLQAAILGRADGDQTSGAGLSAEFVQAGNHYVIKGVRLRFKRQGLWKLASETAASSAAANPSILTATLPSTLDIMSPLDVWLSDLGAHNAGTVLKEAFLLIAQSATDLLIQEAEGMTATGYTSVADAGNNARGGNVLRYTPTGTAVAASGTVDVSALANARVFAIFAAVRNNSTTQTFNINALITAVGAVRTVPKHIDISIQTPRLIPLGLVVLPPGSILNTLRFEISVSGTSGSPTLDIDYLALVDLDDETGRVIHIPSVALNNIVNIVSMSLAVDSQVLTVPAPRVAAKEGVLTPINLPYRGDPFLMSKGNTVSAILLMVGSATAATSWRYLVSGSVGSLPLNVIRYPAYLSPR